MVLPFLPFLLGGSLVLTSMVFTTQAGAIGPGLAFEKEMQAGPGHELVAKSKSKGNRAGGKSKKSSRQSGGKKEKNESHHGHHDSSHDEAHGHA